MKRKLISAFLAFVMLITALPLMPVNSYAAAGVAINETNFPDKNFRSYVKRIFDININDVLSAAELSNVTAIDASSQDITSLKGIEYFTALTHLFCENNQLTSLDLSKNTALTKLTCYNNQLTSLDLSKNTALIYLFCAGNQLTSLDLSNNTALIWLYCPLNQLTSLDVRKNTALTNIDCNSNQLTSLDVSKNTVLEYLVCCDNQLTSLDVNKNTALKHLLCENNQLTSLDVSKNTALTKLTCYNNQLTSLDVSKNTALRSLECGENQLTSLGVSKNTALTKLYCPLNQLTSLDVSKNTALDLLECSFNELTSLDVSKNTALTVLGCSGNQLTSLDISKNTALTVLDCSGNQLTSLDVSKNTALEGLWCESNQLTNLDLSKNTALTDLECYENQYCITVKSNNTFDLSTLPGKFDVRKASNWKGGSVKGNILTVNKGAKEVTYTYNMGNGKTETFKLIISDNKIITGTLNNYTTAVILNGSGTYVSDITINGVSYQCVPEAIIPEAAERLKNQLIDATLIDGKVAEITVNTSVEENKYVNEHIKVYNSHKNIWNDSNFYNTIDLAKLKKNANLSRIWDSVKDVGEVATLSFDKLQINADYYETYLADMMLAFSEKAISENVKWKAGEYYTKGFKNIDTFLKSSKEYYKYEDILSHLDIESAFSKDDISDDVKKAFSSVFKDAYTNNTQLFKDIYQGLDCANEICEDISTGLDAINSLKSCYQAYCVSRATKEINEEFFTFCYDVVSEMENNNPKNAEWFKNAVDKFYNNRQSDAELYLAAKAASEGIKVTYDAFVKSAAKELVYNGVAKALGTTTGNVLSVVAAYNIGVSLAELIAPSDSDSVYYMYYICPVSSAMQTVLSSYSNEMKSSKTIGTAKKYDIAFNTLKYTNIALYTKCYNFADNYRILWIKPKSMKENKEIATSYKNDWQTTFCHKGNYSSSVDSKNSKVVKIHCPVDVTVYNSDNVAVLEIINEKVKTYKNENITVNMCNGMKTIAYPADSNYSIKINSREKGTMNYSVISLCENDVRYVDFYNVELQKGLEFNANIPEKYDAPTDEFKLQTSSETILPDYDSLSVSLGDVNGDGKISIVDAKWILQSVAGTKTLTDAQKAAADLNKDGNITIVDAKWVLQIVAGLRDSKAL